MKTQVVVGMLCVESAAPSRQVVAWAVAALLADVRRGRRATTHGAVRAQLGSRRAGGAGGLAV